MANKNQIYITFCTLNRIFTLPEMAHKMSQTSNTTLSLVVYAPERLSASEATDRT